MKIRYFQKGFNYSQDGPGNRLVYHLQGCNWHCPWCSNPEGIDPCRAAKECDTADLIREAKSCLPMMIDDGGVTLTGGEVLLQWQAARELLQGLHESGISTAIESNLSLPHLDALLPWLDCLMCDCKHYDPEKLHAVTGGTLDGLKENFAALSASPVPTVVRIPLIHTFNDAKEDAKGFLRFFAALPGKFSVEILPYHEYGKEKWSKIGKPYQMHDAFVSKDTVAFFEQTFTDAGIHIVHT